MKKIRYPDETMMRYFTAAFLTGVLFSLLIIWYGKTYYLQKAGLISNFYLRRLKYRSWEKRELLGCFLGKRMKWVALFPVFFFGAGDDGGTYQKVERGTVSGEGVPECEEIAGQKI